MYKRLKRYTLVYWNEKRTLKRYFSTRNQAYKFIKKLREYNTALGLTKRKHPRG